MPADIAQLITDAVNEYLTDPGVDQTETTVGAWVVDELSVRNLVVVGADRAR